MREKRQLARKLRRSRKRARGWSCFWHLPLGHVWAGVISGYSERCLVPGCSGERTAGV